jgi:hypothetical protein
MQICQNIWHDVMIWDVLDYFIFQTISDITSEDIFNHRDEFRKPIEEQSEECISFIYSLI